jgi:hypothetical protein
MNDVPLLADERLDALERTVRVLERRVATIEASLPGGAEPDEVDRPASFSADADADLRTTPAYDAAALLTLIGRTLVALGGAYLLRALTEAGAWPVAVGVLVAFLYATVWLGVAASRPRSPRSRLSAIFHGATSLMIAIPLLWESVTRFHIVGAVAASAMLVAIAAAVLAVAVRTRLQSLAWFAVLAALPASLALTAVTGDVLPFATADIILGVITLWIGYTVDWVWLRWPVALLADVAVLALSAGVAAKSTTSSPASIVVVQLLLLGAYLVSIAIRTLVRGREVNIFEAVQSIAALAVGFGGAVYVAQTTRMGGLLLVPMAVACGAGCYGVAFAFVAQRQGVRRNFYFYTSIALVLVLAGSALGVPDAPLWWAGLAVFAAWLSTRAHRLTLTLHAAIYFIAAAAASGLLASAERALVGPAVAQSAWSPQLMVVFIAGCICWMVPPGRRDDPSARYGRLPRTAIGLVLAFAAGAWLAALVVSGAMDPGMVATVRTSALAVTALALAWLGRDTRLREATWLVYPTLAAGAVKLLAEDFPHSTAATLFVALAMYGGALIAAPRLMRTASR